MLNHKFSHFSTILAGGCLNINFNLRNKGPCCPDFWQKIFALGNSRFTDFSFISRKICLMFAT